MTKEQLVAIVELVARKSEKQRYDLWAVHTCVCKGLRDEMKFFVEFASGAADTKVIKGKIILEGCYLVSKGRELPVFGLKPNAVAEYSSHWPYDYCYFYKL